MLVTFTTPAYADITTFGDVAQSLLRMMGHSATVPGAILAEDVPAARDRLKAALAAASEPPPSQSADADDDEPPVSMAHRALPVLELLDAAARDGQDVMWK